MTNSLLYVGASNEQLRSALLERDDQLRRSIEECADWKRLAEDPVCTHQNLLRGTIKLTREQALHFACAQDYDELKASQQMCVGAAGIGDFSELCGWIDRVKGERDQLKARVAFLEGSGLGFIIRTYEAKLPHYKSALKEVKVALEQSLHHLDEGGNGSKHDPSWIRPVTMTRPEMVDACQQAYHQTHSALATINKVLG